MCPIIFWAWLRIFSSLGRTIFSEEVLLAAIYAGKRKSAFLSMIADHASRRKNFPHLLPAREIDTFNDKQSQIAGRQAGDGRGPGDHSSEAG